MRVLVAGLILGGIVIIAATLRFSHSGGPVFNGKHLSTWLLDLNSPDQRTRDRAAHAIEVTGKPAVPFLIEALQTKNPMWKKPLASFAEKLPDRIAPYAFRLIKPWKESSLRLAAAEALQVLGPEAKEAAPALGKALREDELTISWRASQALARMGAPAVPELVATLDTGRVNLFELAFNALSRIGPDAAAAIPILVQTLAHPASNISEQAAKTLASIGPEAVPELIVALKHPKIGARCSAIHALEGIGPRARTALPELLTLAQDHDPMIRRNAIKALGVIRPTDPSVMAVLVSSCKDPTAEVRRASADALARSLPAPPAQEALEGALQDEDLEVRQTAARVLGRPLVLRDQEFLEQLSKKLRIENESKVQ